MVGLPTENDDDIQATANLLLTIKRKNPGLRLKLGVSTFVPKAHTPFQWNGVNSKAKKRLNTLAKYLKPNGIDFRPESYNWSLIQALISRSDRRLAVVIATLSRSHNTIGEWKKAYKAIEENNKTSKGNERLPPWDEVIHKEWNTKRTLPWTHIDAPLSNQQLINHREKSLS